MSKLRISMSWICFATCFAMLLHLSLPNFAVKPFAGCFLAMAYFVALFEAVLLTLRWLYPLGAHCASFITRITLVSLGLCL